MLASLSDYWKELKLDLLFAPDKITHKTDATASLILDSGETESTNSNNWNLNETTVKDASTAKLNKVSESNENVKHFFFVNLNAF